MEPKYLRYKEQSEYSLNHVAEERLPQNLLEKNAKEVAMELDTGAVVSLELKETFYTLLTGASPPEDHHQGFIHLGEGWALAPCLEAGCPPRE